LANRSIGGEPRPSAMIERCVLATMQLENVMVMAHPILAVMD
jgi:hypothetical protein